MSNHVCDAQDYSKDSELEFSRMDFLKLRDYNAVLRLIEQGHEYAERLEREGGFDAVFGSIKRREQ